MQISTEGKLAILLGLLALGGGGAVWVAPNLTEIGWLMIATAGVGTVALAAHHFSGMLSLLWTPGAKHRMFALLGMIISGAVFVGSAAVYFWPRPVIVSEASALAQLAQLGWSLQHQPDGIQFVVSGSGPLPSMQESAIYFAQLRKPFTLVFSGTNGIEGVHYLSDLSNCKELSVAAGTFTDMSELRGFHHLSALYITQTPISGLATVDLSPLLSLANLRKLNLFGTKVTTIRPLAGLKNLTFLGLKDTLVTDLSPAAAFESLESLDVTGTRISDLKALAANERLRELNIGGAQIVGLESLRGLKALKKLMIMEQGNLDLAPVGELHNLENLWLLAPLQLDVSPLRSLTKLHDLSIVGGLGVLMGRTAVTNVEVIGEFEELRSLALGYLQIADLAFISKLRTLTEITINQLPIQSVEPFRDLKLLTKISLNGTLVVDISPLLDLPALTELRITQTPARADVLTELQRRGVTINR
jgi:hypothetical protein